MGLGVLERLKVLEENSGLTFKSVYNGKLKVHNVPHALFPRGIGPDGEEDYISGDVMYKLSIIFRYMIDNEIFEIDYREAI